MAYNYNTSPLKTTHPVAPFSPLLSPVAAITPPPPRVVEIECKRICVLRCLYAVACNISMQFLLLALFLLFVNFSIFHPLNWITSTISLVFSSSTWLSIMPLLSLIIVYGIYLGKLYLSEQQIYRKKIVELYSTAVPRSLFLLLHISIGILTTWSCSNYLSSDYQKLVVDQTECKVNSQVTCLNEKLLLLSLNGSATAIWYFFKKNPSKAVCEFPIIYQSKHLQFRAYIYSVLWTSFLRTFLPILVSFAFYTSIGRYCLACLIKLTVSNGLEFNESVHFYDIKLLFVTWILTTHILANMQLMAFLFEMFLTEPRLFPIELTVPVRNTHFVQTQEPINDVTLVEALSNTKVHIVRQLAALDLYTLADSYYRRQQIYKLSIPGGHPYNWNALGSQCLALINAYNEQLSAAVRHITATGSQSIGLTPIQPYNCKTLGNVLTSPRREFISSTPTTATELAEKIRIRQYNETHGIRNMLSPQRGGLGASEADQLISPIKPITVDPCQRFNFIFDHVKQRLELFKLALLCVPGINYLFGENELAQLQVLLSISKAQEIAWIVQGLSSIAAHSIDEDRYGVVQINLPDIIETVLRLKRTVDKIPLLSSVTNTTLGLQSKSNQPYRIGTVLVRNAIKRSLYKLTITFADFLPDLIKDANDLRSVEAFLNFEEA